MRATAKMMADGLVTIPKLIREYLGVKLGDTLVYDASGDVLMLERLAPLDAVYHAALADTLGEWASPEDDRAFAEL